MTKTWPQLMRKAKAILGIKKLYCYLGSYQDVAFNVEYVA